jgi:hypothetical protein
MQDRICVALPELKAFYVEGYDDTYYLYYLEERLVDKFKTWVTDAGLYLI